MANLPAWMWVSMLPLGVGAWAPLVPATRCGRRSWALWGVLWSLITLAGWAAAAAFHGGSGAGLLIILGWAGAVATSMSIRAAYLEETGSTWSAAKRAAHERLEQRREAQRMAAEQPALAAELGVGRPDVPGARDAGLVDVNNAGAGALSGLPGLDDATATRIVEVRAEINGFSSLPEMGEVLDLDGHVVERLRDRVVFLPR